MSNWVELWKNESWNKFPQDEVTEFTGTLIHQTGGDQIGFLQRHNPYKLKTDKGETIDVYMGETDDLAPYTGKKVTLAGKLQQFELEGKDIKEIWPNKLKVL